MEKKHVGVTCYTPMYDRKREIPRDKLVDIPEIPASYVPDRLIP